MAYVGSRNKMKFHRIDCRYAKEIEEYNSEDFETRYEAIEEGFKPCKVCKP